jgi:hypothetical protein
LINSSSTTCKSYRDATVIQVPILYVSNKRRVLIVGTSLRVRYRKSRDQRTSADQSRARCCHTIDWTSETSFRYVVCRSFSSVSNDGFVSHNDSQEEKEKKGTDIHFRLGTGDPPPPAFPFAPLTTTFPFPFPLTQFPPFALTIAKVPPLLRTVLTERL